MSENGKFDVIGIAAASTKIRPPFHASMAWLVGVDPIAIGSTNIYNEVRHALARKHRVGSIVLENNIIQELPMVVAAVSPRDSLLP